MYHLTKMELIQRTMDKKFNFQSINKFGQDWGETNRILLEEKTEHYVKFGVYNDFPNEIIRMVNNSSIHNTCVNAVVDAIVGEGLTSDTPEILDYANTEGQSWNDILKLVAKDYKVFGGFALEVIWNKTRDKIAEVYHIDFSYLRAKEKNYRGTIPGYFISDEWGEKYRYGMTNMTGDFPYLPVYNKSKAREEAKQIYVYKPYRPGMKYYPLPDYVGGMRAIEIDIEATNFHVMNLKNGLAPSLAITTFTNADDDQRSAIESMLRMQYAGTNNAGNLLYMDVDSPENAPVITPINTNGADGYYTTINDMVMQHILTAHRITSPEIFGIMTPGKLGGKDEVSNAYLLFLNTVIKPFQQNILDVFDELLECKYGEEVMIGIQQTKLYDDGTTESEVVTSTDAEDGEDTALETEIEISDRVAEQDTQDIYPI